MTDKTVWTDGDTEALAARFDRLPVELKADLAELVDAIAGMSQTEKSRASAMFTLLHTQAGLSEGPTEIAVQVSFVIGRLYRLARPAVEGSGYGHA